MGKKILDSKLLYAILAIIIAIGLWFYVAAVENPDDEMHISGIPITFLNEDVLAENNLMITAGGERTVTLTVVGPRTTLVKLNQEKENITLSIDVGRITSPGEQRMAYNTTLPAGYNSDVTVTTGNPNNIDFTVSRRISKQIDVEGRFAGTLAQGYMQGEFEFLPGTITVSGVESEVNQISHALVTVGGEELTATVSAEMDFALIGFQGEVLEALEVERSEQTVLTTMPVVKTAAVPLEVKLIAGGGATGQYADYEIDPPSITVAGAQDDLDPLKEIILGEIELANVISSDTFEFDIPLNDALENISGETTATVTVAIKGLEVKILEVENIELIHVPEGFEAEPVTQTLQVLARGPAQAISLVLSHNLRVVADLSQIGGAAGRYTVPVKVYLDGASDVGVVGDDYKIVIDLTALS